MTQTLDTIGDDLGETHAWIQMAQLALQAAPQSVPKFEQAIARLERIEAEVARVKKVVAAQADEVQG